MDPAPAFTNYPSISHKLYPGWLGCFYFRMQALLPGDRITHPPFFFRSLDGKFKSPAVFIIIHTDPEPPPPQGFINNLLVVFFFTGHLFFTDDMGVNTLAAEIICRDGYDLNRSQFYFYTMGIRTTISKYSVVLALIIIKPGDGFFTGAL